MPSLRQRLSLGCVLLMLVAPSLSGCATKRTRLREERSALLAERDQDRRPTEDRVRTIDQRVAEIDTELLQMR